MSEIIIRQAEFADAPYLYDICLKTGFSGKNAEELFYDPYMIGQYYAMNYLCYERDCCFVAAEDTLPKAYIIGVSDTNSFNTWMEKSWLPLLRERYKPSYKGKTDFETRIAALFSKELSFGKETWAVNYPAQLHIDILPELQGRGFGRKLVNRFCEHLKTRRICGVHLGLGKKNEKAFGFYKALGFLILQESDTGYMMGLNL